MHKGRFETSRQRHAREANERKQNRARVSGWANFWLGVLLATLAFGAMVAGLLTEWRQGRVWE